MSTSRDVTSLHEELAILRSVLRRFDPETDDIDLLTKHVPRLATVIISAVRTQHGLGTTTTNSVSDILASLLADDDAPEGGDPCL